MKDMGLMHYFLGWKYGKVMGNVIGHFVTSDQ